MSILYQDKVIEVPEKGKISQNNEKQMQELIKSIHE